MTAFVMEILRRKELQPFISNIPVSNVFGPLVTDTNEQVVDENFIMHEKIVHTDKSDKNTEIEPALELED